MNRQTANLDTGKTESRPAAQHGLPSGWARVVNLLGRFASFFGRFAFDLASAMGGQPRASNPLARYTVGQVMTADVQTVPQTLPLWRLFAMIDGQVDGMQHHGYPVVDETGRLVGMVTRSDLPGFSAHEELRWLIAADVMHTGPLAVAWADEPLLAAAERMVKTGVSRLPVVPRQDPAVIVGLLSRSDVLKALILPTARKQANNRLRAA
jgi:CBS domain-containing protein